MTRQELNDLAKNMRDPKTLSDEILAQMKAARVGPFAHDFSDLIAKPHGQPPELSSKDRHKAQTKKPMRSPAAASRTDKADPRGA